MGFRVRNATYRAATEDEITEAPASRDLRKMVEVGLLACGLINNCFSELGEIAGLGGLLGHASGVRDRSNIA
jgi:hypothetical protein